MKKVIDLSAWQENVEWDGLVSEGIDGVILKVGERNRLDDMFIEHVNEAVAHNIPYGIYYYAHANNEQESKEEAQQVDSWIKEYIGGVNPPLGIWYDAEDNSMDTSNISYISMSFVNYLWSIGYNYVGIYSSYNWLANYYDHEVIKDVGLWVANYSSINYLAQEYPQLNIKIWQNTDHYSDEFPYDGNIYYE